MNKSLLHRRQLMLECLILAMVCLIYPGSTAILAQDKHSDPITVELSDEGPSQDKVDKSLLLFKVYLTTDHQQADASKGLQTILVFRNEGSDPIRLFNPKDFTSIQVLTNDGWLVEMPKTVPDWMIDKPPSPNHPRQPDKILIGPGQDYRLALSILQILPIKKRTATDKGSIESSESRQTTIHIPPGKYKLEVRTVLMGESTTSAGARYLVSKPVEVVLGSEKP